MSSQWSLRVCRLAFGVSGIVAVVAQYVVFIDRGGNPVNFFSALVRGAVVRWYPYPFLSPVSQTTEESLYRALLFWQAE